MKKNLTRIIVLFLIVFVFIGKTTAQGQNNHTINYQAVAHSNNGIGNTIINTNINVEISISSDTTISPEFEEFHTVTTNEYGLFSLQIGSINSADFNNIEWSDDNFYLGVSIDGEQMGYQLLVGVPYSFSSLEAVNAKKVNGYTVESNVPNSAVFSDNQTLTFDSDSLYITNGNAIAIDYINPPDNDWTIINNDLYNTNLSGKIGIGTTSMAAKLNVKTDIITNITRGIQVENVSNSNGTGPQNIKVGIYAVTQGGGTADNIGISGQAIFGNVNKGIEGSASGGSENWAGYFGDDAYPGSGNVKINDQLVIGSNSAVGSFQLIDGNQGAGRILKSDSQGNAQWVQVGSLGVGVMLKNVYDTNFNSIVDNAEAINGFQVGIDVPSNAVFTDNQNASEVNYNNNISGLTANNTQAAIDELQLNINNKGDMYSSTYDVNQNGKVDTAETINGFQVGINVPANSVFTDDQILSGNFDPSSKLLTINIENGNTLTADLTPLANQINIDNDSLNEIQTLSISNNTISLNKGGGSVSVPNNVFIDGNNVGVATTFNTTGDFNTASGDNSLININTGSGNSAYGDASLINNSSGDSNSAFGRWSMGNNSTGSSNSAFGFNALKTNATGSNNLAIGADADVSSANLNNATAIGANAKVDISNALVLGDNVKVGIGTSSPNTELDINSPSPVLRLMSTKTNSLASAHIRFGDFSSGSFTEMGWVGLPGSGNYLEIGSPNAIFFNTNFSYRMMIDQSGNVGVGTSSPTEKMDVNGRIRMRTGALNGYIPVSDNNGVMTWTSPDSMIVNMNINDLNDGYTDQQNNLYFFSNPSNNIIYGTHNNIAIGQGSLDNNSGNDNIAIGESSLTQNTTGNINVAVGTRALNGNQTGYGNSAIGYQTLEMNTTGSENTAIGQNSLPSNTTGGQNTAVGSGALISNTIGSANVAIGLNSSYKNIDGAGNTAVGYGSLFQNINGSSNATLGENSLENNQGSQNTAIGNIAGSNQSNGNQNTFIGYNANTVQGANAINNATAIGANARVNQSNSLILGNNANIGIGTSTPSEKLHIENGTIKIGSGSDAYKFPVNDGNSNQILVTDGNGDLTWQNRINNIKEIYISAHDFHTAEEINYPANPNQLGGYPRHVVILGNNGGTVEGWVFYDFPKPTDWTGSNMTVTVYYSGEKNDGNFNFNINGSSYAIGQGGYNSPATSDLLSVTEKYTLYKFTKTLNFSGYNSTHELLTLNISRYDFQNQSQGNPDSNTGLMYIHAIKISYPTH